MQSLAWTLVRRWVDEAANDVAVLPPDPGAGPAALEALAVTDRSVLGALAVNTGGLAVDHGWLRVLGGGRLLEWRDRLESDLVVGHDVVAGFYAVDKEEGEVRYLGPDTLEWTGTEMGHSQWVHWTLAGDLQAFYASLRWPGWEDECAALSADQGLAISPPPFTREGRQIADASRTPAPMAELWAGQQEYIRQYTGEP
jgi:hypothetical protein